MVLTFAKGAIQAEIVLHSPPARGKLYDTYLYDFGENFAFSSS